MVHCKNSTSSLRSTMYSAFSFTLVMFPTSLMSNPIFSSIIFWSSMSLCLYMNQQFVKLQYNQWITTSRGRVYCYDFCSDLRARHDLINVLKVGLWPISLFIQNKVL